MNENGQEEKGKTTEDDKKRGEKGDIEREKKKKKYGESQGRMRKKMRKKHRKRMSYLFVGSIKGSHPVPIVQFF